MKKYLLTLLVLIFSQLGYGQIYVEPIRYETSKVVEVKVNNDIGTSIAQGVQASAAAEKAAAANRSVYNEAMKDNYSKIYVDNLINKTNLYDYIVIERISGWMASENKKDVLNTLNNAKKFQIIDLSPNFKSNGSEISNENSLPDDIMNSPKTLFVNFMREAQGDVNRITQLSIKNSEGKIIYESLSKNLSFQEILKPLISNYIYTKEIALSKIQELKKYFDMGILTKEEYDLKVAELKPFLLGDSR